MKILYRDADETLLPEYRKEIQLAQQNVTTFFASPFQRPFSVKIFPDRSEMDDYWNVTLNRPKSTIQCWMIASATADEFWMLSPRLWSTQACKNQADPNAVTNTIAHELVHVFHAQLNPNKLYELRGRTWFIEGLAAHASGQLSEKFRSEVKTIASSDARPKGLGDFWGSTRKGSYALSGTLLEYIDKTYGRQKIKEMLPKTTNEELLGVLGVSETELVKGWTGYVLAK